MKIQEFIALYETLNDTAIEKLEVKKKLPSLYKLALLSKMSSEKVLYKKNGYAYTNHLLNQIAFHINMLVEYTNLDFSVDEENNLTTALEEYDLLNQMGLIQILLDEVDPEEYSSMEKEFQYKIQTEIDAANSIESVLSKHLTNLYDAAKQLADILPAYSEKNSN